MHLTVFLCKERNMAHIVQISSCACYRVSSLPLHLTSSLTWYMPWQFHPTTALRGSLISPCLFSTLQTWNLAPHLTTVLMLMWKSVGKSIISELGVGSVQAFVCILWTKCLKLTHNGEVTYLWNYWRFQ
jgi:hypothetical protein